MPQLRVALAQVDLTVGDLAGNLDTVLEQTKEAAAQGAHLVVFPEMTLTGYPPEDLVLRRSFVQASLAARDDCAHRLAEHGLGEVAVVVGYLDDSGSHPAPGMPGLAPGRNAAALLWRGEVATTYAKHHLPNYGVFDEIRYFVAGQDFPVVRLHGVDVGLTICEDLWLESGPVATAALAQVGLLLCINGSPFEQGKVRYREQLCAGVARRVGAPVVYVNQVGGQDELVFDGASLVVAADGALLARAPQFEEGLLLVDLTLAAGAPAEAGDASPHDGDAGADGELAISRVIASPDPVASYPARSPGIADLLDDLEELYRAVVVGTRDYVAKNGFSSVVIALSGGIDSALTTTVAVDALGSERVHTVAMPSSYSSSHSLDDAADLAARQHTQHEVVAIAPMVDAYCAATELDGLALENLQARVRGTLLMALSNQHGHLVLTTGNKSELATGFSTLYGDSAGGFAPLKDVPKTLVWELSRWRNASAEAAGETAPIPERSITKPPSAELAPGQLDSDRLPDYAMLDRLLDDYVENDRGAAELVADGFAPDVVERTVRMVDLAEYKRRQNPPGPKLTPKAFGRDRRLPITNRWREHS